MKNTLKFFLVVTATFFASHIFSQTSTSNLTTQGNATSAIQQLSGQSNINDIYPNPNNGEFNVNVSSLSEKAFVTVYSSCGQLILKEKISSSSHLINMKSVSAGSYHLIVFDNNQPVYKTKFIKN